MTDRELLELAAKAAGYEVLDWCGERYTTRDGRLFPWNPMADDGDAFRLEVAMSFVAVEWTDRIEVGEFEFVAGKLRAVANRTACAKLERHAGDRRAARRRAGVLAAAEIGRAIG